MVTLRDQALANALRDAGVDLPELEARWLGEHFTSDAQGLAQAVVRRKAGEPLSRIIGTRHFWSLDFAITPDVLDPRPDTECVVEQAARFIRARNLQTPRVLDIGTGSGCILLALLHEFPQASGVGVDVSEAALRVAQTNAERLGLDSRAIFKRSNWADDVQGCFDVVVANPPYIRSDVIPALSESVRHYDPMLALDGGCDGVAPNRAILSSLKRILDCGGRAFLEIGFDQAEDIARLVDNAGATLVAVHRDFGGQDRVAEITLGEK